jgi:AcrR family transcriptional regulator
MESTGVYWIPLYDEALRTIQAAGVEHLTLRTVGERLGVSRTALYRHFADKQALLATVGREGFRMLRQAVASAWERNGRGRAGFRAMARAYVRFAVEHPSHYRVMFGGFIESSAKDDQFIGEARAAFQVLVDALVEQQNTGDIRRDEPVLMARFIWALVHGTAMLVIDGQLPEAAQREALEQYAVERIFISSLDPRVTIANPVAGYSSFVTGAQFPDPDLGDSEQTPVDLASIADYTTLTAMRAPRPTMISNNAFDSCCFRGDYAKCPADLGGSPLFRFVQRSGQADRAHQF